MNSKQEAKNIVASRYVEFSGYRNKPIRKTRRRSQLAGMIFSFAPVLVMTIFVFVSFVIGVMLTTYSGHLDAGMRHLTPVGAANFSKAFHDPLLGAAIKNSLIFMGITTVVGITAALIVAFLVNSKKVYGKKIFLLGYFLPQITSMVAGTIIFAKIFGSSGALSLTDHPENSIWIVVISGLWVQIAGVIVNFNTAFANLGESEYEAAELDGAKAITKFFKITIPSLMPIIIYQVLMGVIVGMTLFGQSYIMLQLKYVSEAKYVISWATLGFMRSIGGEGITINVGVGMVELILLGLTTLVISLIANKVQPLSGKKGGK